MEVLLLLVMGAANIACFLIGAKIGQKTAKGEDIKLPTVNPLELVQEHREKRAAQEERDKVETILRNIESYDGTGYGQEDVPGR
mgnify:FL=1|jgi:hypothetical protein